MKPLSDEDQRKLYENKYGEWIAYTAPRIRAIYRNADAQTKRDAWSRCSDALRDEINRLAEIDRIGRLK